MTQSAEGATIPSPSPATGTPSPAPKGSSAPIGAEPVSGPTRRPGLDPSQPVASEPRTFNDDDLVTIPGQDKPVKYGELYRRLQADHTRKTQEVARERAEAKQEREALATQRRELEQTAASLVARGQQPAGGQDAGAAFLSALSAKTYLSGADAASLVQSIQQKGFQPLIAAITERDKILSTLHGMIMNLESTVSELSGVHTENRFDSYINETLKTLGLPQKAAKYAKELFLAYEGDDVAADFPAILDERWKELQEIHRESDSARVAGARRSPFPFPQRGGNGAPSQGIKLRGDEDARELADALWDGLQETRT